MIRNTENGATYEDTIDHLFESECEVTGLVFALAGYLTHDLHESIPIMLLDSLEQSTLSVSPCSLTTFALVNEIVGSARAVQLVWVDPQFQPVKAVSETPPAEVSNSKTDRRLSTNKVLHKSELL